MKKNYMKVSVFSVAAVLGVWILGSALNCFNPTFIPSVKDVLDAFWNLWENGYKGYPLMYHIVEPEDPGSGRSVYPVLPGTAAFGL